jgi:hypothetical protein
MANVRIDFGSCYLPDKHKSHAAIEIRISELAGFNE